MVDFQVFDQQMSIKILLTSPNSLLHLSDLYVPSTIQMQNVLCDESEMLKRLYMFNTFAGIITNS